MKELSTHSVMIVDELSQEPLDEIVTVMAAFDVTRIVFSAAPVGQKYNTIQEKYPFIVRICTDENLLIVYLFILSWKMQTKIMMLIHVCPAMAYPEWFYPAITSDR